MMNHIKKFSLFFLCMILLITPFSANASESSDNIFIQLDDEDIAQLLQGFHNLHDGSNYKITGTQVGTTNSCALILSFISQTGDIYESGDLGTTYKSEIDGYEINVYYNDYDKDTLLFSRENAILVYDGQSLYLLSDAVQNGIVTMDDIYKGYRQDEYFSLVQIKKSSFTQDSDSKVFFEEKFLDYLKAKYNVKDDIPSEDYDYDELYDYKNSDGETEWVLVSANYFPAGALDIWFKMEIADRVITSNSVYSPFRFCYGVYDVQSDMFVDLYDLRNTPGKFYGLTDALAELNIGDLIEKTTSFPEETALITSPTKSTETEPTESETTEPTTEIVEPTNEPTNKSVEPTTERFEPTITELDESSITESTEPTTAKVTAKRENPVKITTKTKTVKAKKLKSKKQTVKPLTITKAKGPIKVTLVKSGTTKKIRTKVTVSKKGVITLKKGKYKKDTYKVKLKIIVKGNSNFNPKTLIKTVTVKVK